MAVLLELQGANVFRVRSYQNASRMLGTITQDFGELVASGQLFEMKGIGKEPIFSVSNIKGKIRN